MPSEFRASFPPRFVHGPDAPFPFDPDSGRAGIVSHRTWRETLDAIQAALAAGTSFVLLIGEPGSGRSLMLREVARLERDRFPDLELLDDADRMSPIELMLAEHSVQGPCVLAADGAFESRARLFARPPEIVRLRPMAPDEVARFLAARLERAGLPGDVVTRGAALDLARLSGGIAGRLLRLAADAMREAKRAGDRQITAVHVAAAARRQPGPAAGPALPRITLGALGTARPRRGVRFRMRAGLFSNVTALSYLALGAAALLGSAALALSYPLWVPPAAPPSALSPASAPW